MREISYSGKKVSVGIDVHAIRYDVTCIVEGAVAKRASMKACPKGLLTFLKRFFPESSISTVYEAGFSGFELHRELSAAGIESLVVHAAAIETSARDRVKTDKRDSLKMATQLAAGRLRSIRIPSRKEEAERVLHRTRDQLVRDRSAVKVQIRMKFYQFGQRITESKKQLSLKIVEQRLKSELPREVVSGIRALVGIWKALNVEIAELDSQLRIQAKNDVREKVYRSIPGIGFQTARILSTEVGDMSQFPNERKLASFTGLTPCEYSSGTSVRKGSISRQGNSRLRHILVEAAWVAVRQDADLKKSFLKLASRTGKRRAIVAIARRLLGRARALFRKGELYSLQHATPCAA